MDVDVSSPASAPRRHDLDALRAAAMLLGIALHGAVSYFPAMWPVQDPEQSEGFQLFVESVHGFRMQLFFLLSGFFTMMMYRKKGLAYVARNRTLRIAVPAILGALTIVPLTKAVSDWAWDRWSRPVTGRERSIADAVRTGNTQLLAELLKRSPDIDVPDQRMQMTPLAWAAAKGDLGTVTMLLEHGADVNRTNGDGTTALHKAALLGHEPITEVLIRHGADPSRPAHNGDRAIQTTSVAFHTTATLVRMYGLPQPERRALEAARVRIRDRLRALAGAAKIEAPEAMDPVGRYRSMIASKALAITWGRRSFHLLYRHVFQHLWFLWYLWWAAGVFVVTVWLGRALGIAPLRRLPVLGAARMLWILPPSIALQWLMQVMGPPKIGPGSPAGGLVPEPHLLAYYLVFFTFGVLYYDARDDQGRIGRHWRVLLPISLIVLLPAAIANLGVPILTAPLQSLYAWGMAFGLIGLCREKLANPHPTIRYLSDASYWMYLGHFPLVIAFQALVHGLPGSAFDKFLMVNAATVAVLLVSYRHAVRNTVIGVLLNGRRYPPAGAATADRPARLTTLVA